MALHALTFGIELEFLALYPPTLSTDDVGEALYHAMLEVGIPTTGYEMDLSYRSAPPYSRWRVDTDSLDLSREEAMYVPPGWGTEAIELSSRKFDFYYNGPGGWREEVAKVLQVLRELEGRGCRFLTNKTTGFHVHVGNGVRRIPLRTAKNVFQLLTAHEMSIDKIHAVSRIVAPYPAVYHHYYYPLSFFHANAADPEGSNKNIFDWLANIEEGVTDYNDLGDFFTCLKREAGIEWDMNGHHSSVNFDNLFASEEAERCEENLTGTTEFRQHAGTLDYLEIVAWVMLVANVVEFCSKVSDEDMVHLCLRAGEKDFGLEDLFAALDTDPDVMDHYLNAGSATIGTLSSQQTLGPIPPEGLFNPILEQNDHESAENTDPDEVAAAVAWKYLYGHYGLKPEAEIEVPVEAVIADLNQAAVTVRMREIDPASDDGKSRCRTQVLREFARVYEKGSTQTWFPLTSRLE